MKIRYHVYKLTFRENFGTVSPGAFREGALLEVTFEDGLIGYCDCHPWVELGDRPLQDQLVALSHPDKTPLLQCSLRFARIDAKGRRDLRSVFDGVPIPLSHQIVSLKDALGGYIAEGIHYFKLKAGADPEQEIATITSWVTSFPEIKLRLDFNERLPRADFIDYWRAIPAPVRRCVDFVEDPYRYKSQLWAEDQQHLGVCFAADHAANEAILLPESARYIVHKPAVEQPPHPSNNKTRLVVTSYMDHPLGQMCAAYAAGHLNKLYPKQVDICGLLTQKCYESSPFIDAIISKGPQLLPATGTGFGFNSLLEALPWQNL